jgi:hypothetical protein
MKLSRDLTPPLSKGKLGGVWIHALIQQYSHGKILELLRSSLPHPSPPLRKGRGQENAKGINLYSLIEILLLPFLRGGDKIKLQLLLSLHTLLLV